MSVNRWYPDTCVGVPCTFRLVRGTTDLEAIEGLCVHHMVIHQALLTDQAVFDAVKARNSVKNVATAEAARLMGLEHANVPWRVAADDKIVVTTDPARVATSQARNKIEALTGAGTVVLEEATIMPVAV